MTEQEIIRALRDLDLRLRPQVLCVHSSLKHIIDETPEITDRVVVVSCDFLPENKAMLVDRTQFYPEVTYEGL